jgi:hypothetical protein
LAPGDFVALEFNGEGSPVSARAVFIASGTLEDQTLHAALDTALAAQKMIAFTPTELAVIVEAAGVATTHPIRQLVVDAAVEDVALGGAEGAKRLRQSGRKMSRADLQKAKDAADQCGRRGEEFVNEYLLGLQKAGTVEAYEWVSDSNVIAPYDFKIKAGQESRFVEVKSTTGQFGRPMHVSLSELTLMAADESECCIYRVYELGEDTAKLRIAENVKAFAKNLMGVLASLPKGVVADALSVDPTLLKFSPEIVVTVTGEDEE